MASPHLFAFKMGFRADVENFQPYYRFRPTEKNLANLRIGASILREFFEQEVVKEEESKRVKETVQEALARQRQNVRLPLYNIHYIPNSVIY